MVGDEVLIAELPVDPGEELLGVVAVRRITWGGACVILLRTKDDVIATGIAARWPGQTTSPYLVAGNARFKAFANLQWLNEKKREYAADQDKKRKA